MSLPEGTTHSPPVKKQKRSPSCCAYFSPDDNLQQLLCDYINQEKEGIDVAIFSFTHKKIAEALMHAHKNGIKVRIITDPSSAHDRFSKIYLLQECGIPIYLYNLHYTEKVAGTFSNIMHNKFVVFKNNNHKKAYVWTGSFNFTKSAALSNQENVLVIEHAHIIKKYSDQFERLLTRCKRAL